MPSRIVVFGATGYTGRLTAEQLVAQGAAPVLAGRSRGQAGGARRAARRARVRASPTSTRPETVAALVGPGDVLLSTVGPFKRWGEPAVRAAIARRRRLHRLDRRAAVHPARVRRVRRAGPRARAPRCSPRWATTSSRARSRARSRSRRPAPTRCASTSATTRWAAGRSRSRAGPRPRSPASRPTARSRTAAAGVQPVRSAERVRDFTVRGKDRPGISVGGVEHFTLPARVPAPARGQRLPRLVRPGCRARSQASSAARARASCAIPGVRGLARARAARSSPAWAVRAPRRGPRRAPTPTSRRSPTTTTGAALAEVHVAGADAYDFTARFLAWAARRAADQGVAATGAVGPLEAFGLEALEAGCAEAGLTPELSRRGARQAPRRPVAATS